MWTLRSALGGPVGLQPKKDLFLGGHIKGTGQTQNKMDQTKPHANSLYCPTGNNKRQLTEADQRDMSMVTQQACVYAEAHHRYHNWLNTVGMQNMQLNTPADKAQGSQQPKRARDMAD